jgi:hypothetical protein
VQAVEEEEEEEEEEGEEEEEDELIHPQKTAFDYKSQPLGVCVY